MNAEIPSEFRWGFLCLARCEAVPCGSLITHLQQLVDIHDEALIELRSMVETSSTATGVGAVTQLPDFMRSSP